MIKKGFTLVEVMIVVAIILILASIVIMAGNSARSVARDNQRKTDITLLQLKLESYRERNGNYPVSLNDLSTQGFILPVDPSNGSYNYIPLKFSSGNCANGSASYYLYATFENGVPTANTYATVSDTVNDSLGPCDAGVSLPTDPDLKIYVVTSPK